MGTRMGPLQTASPSRRWLAALVGALAACSGTTGDLLTFDDAAVAIDASAGDVAVAHDLSGHPHVTIDHPADGEVRDAGTHVPLVGHATDPHDGVLSGAALVWRSDRAGLLGTGAMLDVTLDHGTHVVTLTATNSLGLADSASIHLVIQ
jgi:hypothetical protein